MARYTFADRLSASRIAQNQAREIDAIRGFFPDARSVEAVDANGNDGGIDYIATLEGGREITVDAKRRQPGCSRYWTGEEELALELWSVTEKRIVGWTLDTHKLTEYVLFTFHPDDSCRQYLLAFQLLRRAFRVHGPKWVHAYRRGQQETTDRSGWTSECVFVPVSIVRAAVHAVEVRRSA